MFIVQEPHYYFCFKRTTEQKQQGQDRQSYAKPTKHVMRPSGYAKISTQIQKLSKIIGDILLPDERKQKMVLNPLIEYFIFRSISYDFITPDFKLTGYTNITKNMYESAISSIAPGDKKDDKTLRKAILNQFSKAFDPIFQDYFNNKEYPRWSQTETRVSLLKQHNEFCQKSKESCKKSYLQLVKQYRDKRVAKKYERDSSISTNNNDKRKKYFFEDLDESQIQRFVDAQFEEVGKVQTLKKHLQVKRLKQYVERNKGYFNFEYCQLDQYKNQEKIHAVKFNALSNEEEAVLLTFQDYMQLRQDKYNYEEESQDIIIDLCEQLHKYTKKISKQDHQVKGFYIYLSPENAVIDQLSLKPKFSFIPCVEQAFGMKVKPHSIQLKLVFDSTPKTFDYFQSQMQLNQSMNSILKDPYYAHEFVFQKQDPKLDKARQQYRQLQPIFESICVDRFLLLSYLILKNKPFGKNTNKKTNQQIKEYFRRQLTQKKKAIAMNRKGLSIFLGQRLIQRQESSNSFNFKLEELTKILERRPNDSEVEKHRFNRFYSLSAKRHIAIREITRIINIKQRPYSRMAKIKKYLLILFTFFIQIIFEYLFIYKNAKRNPKDLLEIYRLLQLDLQNRSEPFIGVQKNALIMKDKVNKMIERIGQDRQDNENKMIIRYQKALKQFLSHRDQMKELYKRIKAGNQKQQPNIIKIIQNAQKSALQLNEYNKDFIFQFVFPQLNVRYANNTKGNEQPQANKQVTRRLQLSIFSFITSSQQNFMIYDSLVFPALNIRKENLNKQYEDLIDIISKRNVQRQKQRMIASCRQNLNEVDDIMTYTLELKKSYTKLKIPIGRWFINNDVPINNAEISRPIEPREKRKLVDNQNKDEEREDVQAQNALQKRGINK